MFSLLILGRFVAQQPLPEQQPARGFVASAAARLGQRRAHRPAPEPHRQVPVRPGPRPGRDQPGRPTAPAAAKAAAPT
ncbi:MAG: hypothetical protein WKG07_29710 [Hymenobacter sp.]